MKELDHFGGGDMVVEVKDSEHQSDGEHKIKVYYLHLKWNHLLSFFSGFYTFIYVLHFHNWIEKGSIFPAGFLPHFFSASSRVASFFFSG